MNAGSHEVAHWALTDWYSLAHVTILASAGILLGRKAISAALKSRSQNIHKQLS